MNRKDYPSAVSWNPRVLEGELGYFAERVGVALWGTLESPNEVDRNGEPANVVDGLFAIARALDRLASAVDGSRARR